MAPNGTVRNLTGDGAGQDYFVSWAFNNDMLNFLSSRSGEMGPAQVRPDGSELRTLSILQAVLTVVREQRIHWDPAWSPDGERMVWSSVRDLNLEIYLADGDGENQVRLTEDSGRDWFPAWSPDGTRVAFNSDREGNENLYVIELESGELTQLTDHPADDIYAMWSLDGETILFVSERDHSLMTGQVDLFLMNADGSDPHLLGADETFIGDPTYSSDGAQVAYVSNEEGSWSIYVMDAGRGDARRITGTEANDLFPVWRPVPEESEEEGAE
jgi:Tol biopolymer transport system component